MLLLVDLFALTWFAYKAPFHVTAVMLGQQTSANGWHTFEVIGPFTLLVCLVGIAICVLAASRRSPAVPVVLTTLLLPLSFVLVILIAIRVLLRPTDGSPGAGRRGQRDRGAPGGIYRTGP